MTNNLHNNPPEPVEQEPAADPAAPVAAFKARVDTLTEAANIWIKAVPEITTDDEAARCKDFRDQVRAESAAIANAHKIAKAPYLEAGKKIDAIKNALTAPLDVIDTIIARLQTKWLQKKRDELDAERKRLAAEAAAAAKAAEEAKKAAEAAAPTIQTIVAAEQAEVAAVEAQATADAAAKAKAHIRGDFSQRATGLRTTWRAVIVDYPKVLDHFKNETSVREAVQSLANKAARTLQGECDVPGMYADDTETSV